jgi:hypothetical protein
MSKLKIILILVAISASISFAFSDSNKTENLDKEWQSLFNGKNLDGWIVKINHHELGDNYANTFRVVDGKIQVNYDDYGPFNEQFGHMFYREPFSSYHLKFEYRITDQWLKDAPSYAFRNSGVMFHSQDPKTILKDQDWPISVEFQLLADAGDGQPRPTGNMCSPGTDVFINRAKYPEHCINSSSKTYGLNEWVSAELIVYRDSLVIHIINGDTVLQYTNPQIGGGVVNGCDPSIKIDGKPLTGGYIALQSEGNEVEFREIKIKKLD